MDVQVEEKLKPFIENLKSLGESEVSIKKFVYNTYEHLVKNNPPEKALRIMEIQLRKLMAKSKLLSMSPGEEELNIIILGVGKLFDRWSSVVDEINKVINSDGLATAIEKGMVKEGENGKPLFIDFRVYDGNTENKYYNQVIDEIPDEIRYRRTITAIVNKEIEGQSILVPAIIYVNGRVEIDKSYLFKPVKITARKFSAIGNIELYTTKNFNIEMDLNNKLNSETVIKIVKDTPFYKDFDNLRKYSEELNEKRASGGRVVPFIISIADVWRLEETTNTYRILLSNFDKPESEPIQAYIDKDLVDFGEFSKILFTGNIFTISREFDNEKIEDVAVKIQAVYPINPVKPDVVNETPVAPSPDKK